VVVPAIALCSLFAYSNMFAYGEAKTATGSAHIIVDSKDLKWTPIIKGCEIAPVIGDYKIARAQFVLRFRCVDGAKVPAHWHPQDEYLTVLSGTFLVADGDSYDEKKLHPIRAGGFLLMPKDMRHFALNRGATIVQINGEGPFMVNWVNPAEVIPPDAPAAAKPKS
jgi:quercetin dioxygenase-like cupin family protein